MKYPHRNIIPSLIMKKDVNNNECAIIYAHARLEIEGLRCL